MSASIYDGVGDNWWEQSPTFPTTPWIPHTPTFPDPTPSLPYTYPVYTDQPVKCPQCGVWWRGTEHRCNLNFVTTTTTNVSTVPNAGESLRDAEKRIAKLMAPKKRKGKKVDKKQPPDIIFK